MRLLLFREGQEENLKGTRQSRREILRNFADLPLARPGPSLWILSEPNESHWRLRSTTTLLEKSWLMSRGGRQRASQFLLFLSL